MGIEKIWQQDFVAALVVSGFDPIFMESDLELLAFKEQKLIVNLISLNNIPKAGDMIELQERYSSEGFYYVNLWEDIWLQRKMQVMGRIDSILGLNKRIHARKTNVVSITQEQADVFLEANHLQGSVKARYKFALMEGEKMVAVATFSNLRLMRHVREGYRSAELVRFAALLGYTVVGGFTKVLQHFIEIQHPDDIMSYADRDWSLGHAYEKSGFKLLEVTPPLDILLDKANLLRHFPHRLSAEQLNSGDYLRIFNTGNLKYLLYLS